MFVDWCFICCVELYSRNDDFHAPQQNDLLDPLQNGRHDNTARENNHMEHLPNNKYLKSQKDKDRDRGRDREKGSKDRDRAQDNHYAPSSKPPKGGAALNGDGGRHELDYATDSRNFEQRQYGSTFTDFRNMKLREENLDPDEDDRENDRDPPERTSETSKYLRKRDSFKLSSRVDSDDGPQYSHFDSPRPNIDVPNKENVVNGVKNATTYTVNFTAAAGGGQQSQGQQQQHQQGQHQQGQHQQGQHQQGQHQHRQTHGSPMADRKNASKVGSHH